MKHELYKELTKPRFLLDNITQEAFEFLDMNEHFVKFSEDDVEWNTLRDVPGFNQ